MLSEKKEEAGLVLHSLKILDDYQVTLDDLEDTELASVLYTIIYPRYSAGTEQGRIVRKLIRRYEHLVNEHCSDYEPLDITIVETPAPKKETSRDIFGRQKASQESVQVLFTSTTLEETCGVGIILEVEAGGAGSSLEVEAGGVGSSLEVEAEVGAAAHSKEAEEEMEAAVEEDLAIHSKFTLSRTSSTLFTSENLLLQTSPDLGDHEVELTRRSRSLRSHNNRREVLRSKANHSGTSSTFYASESLLLQPSPEILKGRMLGPIELASALRSLAPSSLKNRHLFCLRGLEDATMEEISGSGVVQALEALMQASGTSSEVYLLARTLLLKWKGKWIWL